MKKNNKPATAIFRLFDYTTGELVKERQMVTPVALILESIRDLWSPDYSIQQNEDGSYVGAYGYCEATSAAFRYRFTLIPIA